VNASGKRSRPSLNIIHSLTRSAVRTWSTVTRLRTHNSTVPRTELQQSKCFTEHEYRCSQRSILRPIGELKWPYITPYRAIELTRVLWCAKHERTKFITRKHNSSCTGKQALRIRPLADTVLLWRVNTANKHENVLILVYRRLFVVYINKSNSSSLYYRLPGTIYLTPWALSKMLWKHTSSTRPTRHATDSHPSAPPIHSFMTYGVNQRNICDWLID